MSRVRAGRAAVRCAHAVADPVDRVDEDGEPDDRHQPEGPARQAAEQSHGERERPEHEGPVALAHGAVIAPRRTDHGPERTRHLGNCRQKDHRPDARPAERRHEHERQYQRGIGDHVGQLVEIGAERALLAELAREHAVDGVEGHAQEHPGGEQQEEGGACRIEGEQGTERDGTEQRGGGDDVCRDAAACESCHQRAQQGLEGGLELVEGEGHGPTGENGGA